MRLRHRLDALEGLACASSGFHVIIQRSGQTEDEATASYEAEHGPIPTEGSVLRVVVRKP